MSRFGLSDAQLRDALGPVLDERSPGSESLYESFARVAWSTIAEPGDAAAGALVTAVGAARSLSALLGDDPRGSLAGLLADAATDATVRPSMMTAAVRRWQPRTRSDRVFHSLTLANHAGCRLLLPHGAGWPSLLADLGIHAPLLLWCRGALGPDPLTRSVALVGARAATGYGEHVALESSAALCERGLTIVSGAAYGIDGACHRAALASRGRTAAFLAGGLDRFYPAGHSDLLEKMTRDGAVLSEVPCGTAPSKWRFLQRNRLIAAATRATVVIEAGWRSGSLNTAGHAASLGRPLGAVPGPVTSPSSAGCHRLIREFDAACVTSASQMLELVDGVNGSNQDSEPARRSSAQTRTLDALSTRSARSVADVAERSGQSLTEVTSALGTLSVTDEVRETERGWLVVARRRQHR